MHFSHAIVTALTIVASQSNALPIRNAAGPSSAGLQARGWQSNAIDTLAARGLQPDVARESMGVFARYANVEDEYQRSVFIARDLSKRGILDMLVAALRDIIVELLGSSGTARKRDSTQVLETQTALQELTGLNFSTAKEARQSWSTMLDALSKALHQESIALAGQANSTTSANSTSSITSSTNGTASVNGTAVSPGASAASAVGDSQSATAKSNKAYHHDKRSVDLMERQEGVEGLLQVLRNLVDAILNTLLPMSSRSESSDSGSSDKTCPPPGTPNNGQYIPGCPGYGRREVTDALLQVRDAASASQSLQELMPLLEELIQRLPEMMGGDSTATSTDSTASTTASSKTSKSTVAASAGASGAAAASQGASSSFADHAAAPISAAKLSINARSLMEADGFEMEKRQTSSSLASAIESLIDDLLESILGMNFNSTDTNSTSNASKSRVSDDSDSSSDSGSLSSEASLLSGLLSSLNRRDGGGLDISLLNNLLGNLLSGSGASQSADSSTDKRDGGLNLNLLNNLLGNLLSGSNSSQSANSNTKRDGGLNLNLLNNVLGNLLSGHDSSQSANSNTKREPLGGLNINALNNLLGNLLSGDNASQSADSSNNGSDAATKRDGGLNLNLLNNLLGNLLSGSSASQSADSSTKRDGGGLNLNLLNNLLGNLLSGDNASQSADSSTDKRDGGLNLNLLNNLLGNLLSGDNSKQSADSLTRRADFLPVWDELKNLGNKHFDSRSESDFERRSNGFTPVWTSFRNMIDDAYAHGVQRRSPLPMPSPKVDTSAFTHAASTFIKQSVFGQHNQKRDSQFQPLIQAAGTFAKSQMQEWTDALNEHSAKHGKIQA